jgi:hypothetical protein
MFSLDVVDTDDFIDMPTSARELYYSLGMRADDDGFITPKRVMRMVGASEDDLKVLVAKGYVIPFESGVVVVRHWPVNNYIQKDRYTKTKYQTELDMLGTDNAGAYKLASGVAVTPVVNAMDTERIHSGYTGKVRLGKGDAKASQPTMTAFDSALNEFTKMRKAIRKPLTDRAKELIVGKLESMYPGDEPRQIKCLEQSIENSWQGVFELKQGGNRNGSVKLG